MGRVKQVSNLVQIQGDGSTTNWLLNLTESPFNFGGGVGLTAVSVVDPTGTYTPAGLLSGTVPGYMTLAVGAAIPNNVVQNFIVTCTLTLS